MQSRIVSGRTGEDTNAIRRNWPFPDPPLKLWKWQKQEYDVGGHLTYEDFVKATKKLEHRFERA